MNNNDNTNNVKQEQKTNKKSLFGLFEVEQPVIQAEKKIEPSTKETNVTVAQPINKATIQQDQSKLTEEEKLLLNTGDGVNLIPTKSTAEVKKDEKKYSFNITSILSLVILVVLLLGVVFFNIISKMQLNAAKEDLYSREDELLAYSDKIISNGDIMDRIDLYKYLEKSVFSPKEIIEYVMNIVNRSGSIDINSFDLGNDLSFEMSGTTTDLAAVSKLWYLLGTDEYIENINLESVGKNEYGASFSFKGVLDSSNFIGK